MTELRSSRVFPQTFQNGRNVWELDLNTLSCGMNEENDQQEITSTDSNILTESGGSEMLLFRNPMDDEDLDIFECFKSGEINDVENLVDKLGPEILSSRDKHGYTIAHWVCLDGHCELLRYLIEKNAPIDLPCLGIQGPHPIHWAARKGHTAIIQLLLQTGQVNVNTADFKGFSCLFLINYFKDNFFFLGLTPLITSAIYGKTITACYLLGMGAQHHLTDINGDAAIHWASYKGHYEIIQILINSGVELQKTDNFGSTPLHLSCLSGNIMSVKLLCQKRNLDLQPKDKNEKTPLMLAQSHRHYEIVKLLQNEMKKKSRIFPAFSEVWGWLFGGAGNSKGALFLFLVSVLCWGYPMYVVRFLPLTWNSLRRSHYSFIYFNILMWVSWLIANRRNPGFIPTNSDSYFQAIKQIPYFDKWKKRSCNAILSRLCHSCRCLRPLRAKHCRICNRCVQSLGELEWN